MNENLENVNVNEELEKMESMTPVKAVMTNAIPAMLIMVMALVYNMADLFFIGRTGNDLMVAAISLDAPLFLMFMALGNVFGIGGASLLSRCLGRGDKDAAKRISSFVFGVVFVLGFYL